MTGDYWGYIATAYGVTALVAGGVAVWILWEHRRLRAELARYGSSPSGELDDAP